MHQDTAAKQHATIRKLACDTQLSLLHHVSWAGSCSTMILPGTPEQWGSVWDAVEQEMADSTEKGLTVIFSVHEVETVCAVKMMQVRRMQPGRCRAVGHRATAAPQPSHSSPNCFSCRGHMYSQHAASCKLVAVMARTSSGLTHQHLTHCRT